MPGPDPTARALHLLELLGSGRAAGAADLAAELGVSVRTVRRDTERLRGLGYPIESRPGPGGVYRLVTATAEDRPRPLPTPALEPDELAATVRALQRYGDGDPAVRALAKLGAAPRNERTAVRSLPLRLLDGCLLYRGFSTVRARIPSVARILASGITGKMSSSR